jgi:hypothetical protein
MLMHSRGIKGWLVGLAIVALLPCTATASLGYSPSSPPALAWLLDLLPGLLAPQLKLTADCYPQALPNDGLSSSLVSVHLLRDGKPLAGVEVLAQVEAGGGMLRDCSVVTDDSGLAEFKYQAGLMPEPARISFSTADSAVRTEVKLPLAPLSYLDVQVITPEEYAKLKARQVSAAPIYTLELSGFPLQLAADGGSLAMLTATLRHSGDGKPAAGVALKAELLSGDGALSLDSNITNAQGQVQIYFTAGRIVGTTTVRVLETSTGLAASLNILLVEPAGARVELSYKDPLNRGESREGALLPADGTTGLPVVAKVTDLNGLPLRGVEVRVEILDNGDGRIEIFDAVSNASGEVLFTCYAGMRTGKLRLRAFAAAGLPLPAVTR